MGARRLSAFLALVGVGGILALASSADAASLEGDYRFDDNLDSSLAGAPPLTPAGPGISLFETKAVNGMGDRVLSFPAGTGLRLDPVASLDRSDYSVIATFAWDALSGYQRILAFEPEVLSSDSGLYSYDDYLDFYYDEGNASFEGPAGALTANEFADLSFTRAANGQARAFLGDVEQTSFTDALENAVIGSDGLRFFKDDGSEDGAGSVARIRIYDGVLTPAEIATIRATGGLPATGSAMGKPRLLPRKARKAKRVDSAITVFCPSEGVSCGLKGKLKRAKKQRGVPAVLGKLSGEVDAGAAAHPKIKLSKKGRKAVKRKGRIKIKAEVTITPASGKSLLVGNGGKL